MEACRARGLGLSVPYVGHCVRVIGRDTVMCEQILTM